MQRTASRTPAAYESPDSRLPGPKPGYTVIPYVIAYSNELVTDPIGFEPYAGKLRLAYQDSKPSDWVKAPSAKAWERGILRARIRELRHNPARRGPERIRTLHVHRQWLCMDKLLCQVCARPATDTRTDLVPWLLPETAFERTGLKTGRTHAPPTCWDCIPKAMEEWLQGSASAPWQESDRPGFWPTCTAPVSFALSCRLRATCSSLTTSTTASRWPRPRWSSCKA